ncbi:MAG TPA: LPS export ABC transporter periplasmic protein LptC [Micropepsaceae bacterium]|nr:LPS export ABC transporter periplasmic protein LptC [Micropepsaceae bacterium]
MQGDIKKAQEFATAQLTYRARQFRYVARATLRGARRYSIFVRVMKGALPLSALGLAILVLVYVLQPPPARMQMAFQRLSNLAGDMTMDNPRLSGTDNDGQPFVISARRAVPDGTGVNHIRMQDMVADFSLKDGTGLHLTAATGLIDTNTRVLQMSGGIHVTSQSGYDVKTPSAVADLGAGTVHGESGIAAEGAFGRVTAQRFAIDRESKRLQFWGNIHMLLNPESGQQALRGNRR